MDIRWSKNHFYHLDLPLLFGLAMLSMLGLMVLYSASGQSTDMVIRQIIRLGLGWVVLLFLAQIRPQHLLDWIPWLYLLGISMLLAVLLFGDSSKGSQRWLNLGVVRFQPSELMKLVVPMMIAWYLAEKPLPPTLGRTAVALLLIMIPVLFVAKQPDLGTSLIIASSGVFVLLLAGLQWRLIAVAVGLILPISLWGLWQIMYPYQRERVMTMFNPESDPHGSGYQIIQSKIAIGSGGWDGKGYLQGTQSRLEFLPERSTDFIFAVYSEEFGLIGVLLLLTIYIFILTRGMMIAVQAQGTFPRLLAGSLILTFFVYIFVNIGMVIGLLPVVGVPLPLISYGGTSIVTLMAGFGLLMAIHTHKRLLSG